MKDTFCTSYSKILGVHLRLTGHGLDFCQTPRKVVGEVHVLQLDSTESDLNAQDIRATVDATNEVQQSVLRSMDSSGCIKQMTATISFDTNDEHAVSVVADDIDEIHC
ncbi:hypothetical protein HJC23_009957 [Cyclotella cryptica]|uniref:Uncharacterized protein n=1 Tax=Cyclotella cryptica TaxID=29204 RepID=A0ABD3Q971_9STRA